MDPATAADPLDGLPVAIWSGPFPRGAATSITAGIRQLTGYGSNEWIEHPDLWGALARPKDRERMRTVEDLEPGGSLTLEYRLTHREGHGVWIRDLIGRSVDGRELRGVMLGIDGEMSARRQARRLQQHLARVSEVAEEVFFTRDPGGALFLTEAYERIVGRPRAQALDDLEGVLRLVHPSDEAHVLAAVERLRTSEESVSTSFRIVRDDGEVRWIHARASRSEVESRGEHQPGSWIQGLARDVTRERLEQEAHQQAQRLESLGTVAGSIAHDFNNMLVAVLGNAELARGHASPGSELAEMLEDIVAGAERGAALCSRILTFAGRGGRGRATEDLRGLVEELLPLMRATGAQVELRLADEPCLAAVQHTELEQVVQNLVVNAAEACGRADARVQVSVSRLAELPADARPLAGATRWDGPAIQLRVEDSGPGVAPEAEERMFEPFFSTKARSGRGLGLSTVFGILKAHGGLLRIGRSEELGGARFEVFLQEAGKGPGPEVSQEGPDPAALVVRSQRVLVVDDDAEVRGLARRTLESAGHLVLEAPDLATARQRIGEMGAGGNGPGVVDLVLLDQSLPDGEGLAWFEEWRGEPGRPGVVLSSGAHAGELPVEPSEVPRLELLPKPYHPRDLLGLVARLVEAKAP